MMQDGGEQRENPSWRAFAASYIQMGLFLFASVALFATAAAELDDAGMRSLLAKVKQNEDVLAAQLERFGYNEKVDLSDGKKRTIEEYEVTNYKGRKIRRLIARDGKPLAGSELEKENKRIEKLILKMEKGDIPPLSNRRLRTEDLIAAGAFTNIHREQVQGREVTVCDFGPRPNYKPRNVNERFIQNLKGRLWVDHQKLQVVRADFALIGSLKIAGGLFFNMKPGTKFFDEQQWFDNRIWLPKTTRVTFLARAMMAKSLNIERRTDYSQYRRFDVSATDTVQ